MKLTPSNWANINQNPLVANELPFLADCPWPHPESHCSPCSIYLDEYRALFPVWGEYAGDPNRKRFYAQTSCTDTGVDGQIKRVFFLVSRTQIAAPPEGDGLFIGLVEQETLNDPAKLYDPSQWIFSGYMPDLPGGTPAEYYYICFTTNIVWPDSVPLILLICTNGSHENVGWNMGGFGYDGFTEGILPLWKYSENEPGNPYGWTQMDNFFRGCFVPYTEGIGATVEPSTNIVSPSFPNVAEDGVPYIFSFTQRNIYAFPCSCPSTIWYDIIDRDTGTPLSDIITQNLECGYSGINWQNSITFTGSGTFHGQLRVGHYIGGTWPIDETYDFDVVINGNGDGEVYLAECVTCDWVEGCDHGFEKTQFTTDEEIHCSRILWTNPETPRSWYGEELGYRWYHNGSLFKQNFANCTVQGEYVGMCQHCWCSAVNCPGPGTGYIEAYWQGQYMGRSNEYTITSIGDVIGDIVEASSTFNSGPYQPGSYELIAIVNGQNTGTTPGRIYVKEFIDGQEIDYYWFEDREPLTPFKCANFYYTIPAQSFTAGIKVWGESETEPAWGAAGTKKIHIKTL